MSSTIHHIEDHYATISHSGEAFRRKHMISREKNDELKLNVISLIAYEGLPFRIIDSDFMQHLAVGLPHRKSLKSIIHNISVVVEERVGEQVTKMQNICLSFDEWCSHTGICFLGVNCSAWHQGSMHQFCLGVESFDSLLGARDHLSAGIIAEMVAIVIERFHIETKILLFVTDGAKVMTKACVKLCARLHKSIKHGNCIAHLFNCLLGNLVNQMRDAFQSVFDLRNRLATVTFTHYLREVNARYTSLPSFSEVRWYSLVRLMKVISRLRDHIRVFYQKERSLQELNLPKSPLLREVPVLDEKIFEFIDKVLPIANDFKTATAFIEADAFGCIGMALPLLFSLKESVISLGKITRDLQKAVDQWMPYFEQQLARTKANWKGFLQAACILHPATNHAQYLQSDEIRQAITWIRAEMLRRGWSASRTEMVTHEATGKTGEGAAYLYIGSSTSNVSRFSSPKYSAQ